MSSNIHVNPEEDFLNFIFPYEETDSSVTVSASGERELQVRWLFFTEIALLAQPSMEIVSASRERQLGDLSKGMRLERT